MSHDLQAAWASAEITSMYKKEPGLAFANPPPKADLSVFWTRETRSVWPVADGVIALHRYKDRFDVALEYKRRNEGLHGTLTALGQAHAYIHKGFAGAVIVIPKVYDTYASPGEHLRDVLKQTSDSQPISVLVYDEPDPTHLSPFSGKLVCLRNLQLGNTPPVSTTGKPRTSETQWMHIREGDCAPDWFFRYLQVASDLASHGSREPPVTFPRQILQAVQRVKNGADPLKFLSHSAIAGDDFHDKVWRNFWFRYIFHPGNYPIWSAKSGGSYRLNSEPTLLQRTDGKGQSALWCRRSDSVRCKLILQLNARSITEEEAWDKYVENVSDRAHSVREDVDSSLEALRMLTPEGHTTELGDRFARACQQTGDANSGVPRELFRAALIQHGQLGALLHFTFKLSEARFEKEPLAFAKKTKPRGRLLRFNDLEYRQWLEDKLANDLNVLRKVSARGGVSRKPLQSEISTLRAYGLVKGYRVGVGLEINWPAVQQALECELE